MIHLCITTLPPDRAEGIARSLVEERLAACANVIPGVRSIYRWRGKICDDGESLVLFKTSAAARERFERRLRELHPYECPELLVVPIDGGFAAYFDWVSESAP